MPLLQLAELSDANPTSDFRGASSDLRLLTSDLRSLAMSPLQLSLCAACVLFAIGVAAALSRSNAILVLLGVELMLNAANVSFVAFWRFGPNAAAADGVLFVIFSIAVAAAEAAVGLALVIAIYRHQRNIRLQEATRLHG